MNSALKPTHDEVFRRMGRNLFIFQQIEGLLKFLLVMHKAGGAPADFKERIQQRSASINKTMLGHLVEKYLTDVLRDAGAPVPEEESPADWFTFSFRIALEAEFIESLRRDLKLLTEQRNELVHGFLGRWQPDSQEKLEEALAYLDAQREKALPILDHLRTIAGHLEEGWKQFSDFLASGEYKKQSELLWLQASPLVSLLKEVATGIHRKDGWTYLAHAGAIVSKELPEEVQNLKERYKCKTLKQLLVGSGLFDVFDEPLLDGRFRTIYKNKDYH